MAITFIDAVPDFGPGFSGRQRPAPHGMPRPG